MINRTVQGDLLARFQEGEYDVIVHGCNCFHTMGAGIAKQIKEQFPMAYYADVTLTESGDHLKLGTYTSEVFRVMGRKAGVIVNAYTQFSFNGRNLVDYSAITAVFERINKDFAGKHIGIPKIGAGLAGGNWKKISYLIDDATPDVDIELVEWVS